jgi:hypothetical protein
MSRHSRAEFLAFGVLPTLNALAMLIHGLNISTRGSYGESETIPVLLGLAAASLLQAAVSAVRRGRDIGWPAKLTIPAFVIALGLGPVVLVPVGILAFAHERPGAVELGPPPAGMTISRIALAFVLLVMPWFLLLFLARLW